MKNGEGKALYTWDELYERAIGATFGSAELRAKDIARETLEAVIFEIIGENVNDYEIPEDAIEDFLKNSDKQYYFDENGHYIE